MRNSDVDAVLNEYLYCGKKKHKPRMHHSICESRCRYIKNCIHYKAFRLEREEGVEVELPKKKRVVRKSRRKTKKSKK